MTAAFRTFEIPSILLCCPHLMRDVNSLVRKVPGLQVLMGMPVIPGEEGCLQMHQEAVRIARRNCWPWVLAMEDDCLLTPAFSTDRLLEVSVWARDNGYGVVQGGSVLTTNPRLVAPGLVAVDRACSAHFMVYLESGYDAVLKAEQPFDLTIGDLGIKPVLTLPYVAVQRKGLSGIGMPMEVGASKTYVGVQMVDYEGMFDMHERMLLEMFKC